MTYEKPKGQKRQKKITIIIKIIVIIKYPGHDHMLVLPTWYPYSRQHCADTQ